MASDANNSAPRLLLKWESLPGHVQAMIAYPVLTVVLFIVHITVLRQPVERGLFYGFFWAVPATFLVVIATRTESAKRRGLLDDDEHEQQP